MDAQTIVRELLSREEAIDREIFDYEQRIRELAEEKKRIKVTLSTLDQVITASGGDSIARAVTPGVFAGMSVVQATVRYLAGIGTPQTTKEIVKALTAGGIEFDVKDPYNKLYLALRADHVKPESELFL